MVTLSILYHPINSRFLKQENNQARGEAPSPDRKVMPSISSSSLPLPPTYQFLVTLSILHHPINSQFLKQENNWTDLQKALTTSHFLPGK